MKRIIAPASFILSAALLSAGVFAESRLYEDYIDFVVQENENEYRDWYEYDADALENILWFASRNNMLEPDNITEEAVAQVNGLYEAYSMGALTPAGLVGIKKTEITGISNAVYTGKAIAPKPKVSYGGKTLVLNRDYTLRYNNIRDAGIATVTITGFGDYFGVVNKNFRITTGSIPCIKSLKVVNKKAALIWTGVADADGYQIICSVNNDSYKIYKTIDKNAITSFKTDELEPGNTYAFAIRSYKTVDGSKSYSKTSEIKRIKV